MATLLDPTLRIFDNTGEPMAGAKLYFYQSRTSTALATYSDVDLKTANAHPVVADAEGRTGTIFGKNQPYKLVIKTQADMLVRTVDPMVPVFVPKIPSDVVTRQKLNTLSQRIYDRMNVLNTSFASLRSAGEIILHASSTAPQGTLMCDGRSLRKSSYPELYTAIGGAYGESGKNFNIPDLRGRKPIGVGKGYSLSNIVAGQKIGHEDVTLTKNNIPRNIGLQVEMGQGGFDNGPHPAYTPGNVKRKIIPEIGQSEAFSVRNPALGVYFYIVTGK